MIIKSNAGLCNKLRVLFSYYYYYKNNKENYSFTFIWITNKACNGFFLDYFEPIENINIINKDLQQIDIFTNSQHKNTRNKFIYNNLKLKPYLQEIIDNNKFKLGKYISVHIRRTDTVSCRKKKEKWTPYEKYIDFINKYKDYNIYIATDNYETQSYFYNLFKDKIKCINIIEKPKKIRNNVRQTSLENAIIDIYMCINSEHFLGSDYSSFTDIIKQIKDNKKNNI